MPQTRRILGDVLDKSNEWMQRHKKAVGGLGAGGVVGAAGIMESEALMDYAKRGLGAVRRASKISDVVEKAEDDSPSQEDRERIDSLQARGFDSF